MPIITKQPEWTKTLSDDDFSRTVRNQLIVWSNIFHWRKYRWLSQQELAEKAKITQAIISELENGDYNPSMEMLTRIADALSLKLETLTKEKFNWKFFEALNFFISKIKNVDILKLMKLMYFTDLEAYDFLGYKLTGMEYYRWHAWPFNNNIYIANEVFQKNDKWFEQKQNLEKNVALTKDDEKFLDKIVEKYWSMWSTEIRDKSYETKPMEWCTKTNGHKMGEKIF